MEHLVKSIYRYSLPFELREKIHVWRHRDRYRTLRHDVVENYSLKPFDEHACLFVHIPKTGGVSIARSLFGNLAGGHLSVYQYKMLYTPEAFAGYYKFTFVRNPWDRLVSAFTFLKGGGITAEDQAWAQKYIGGYPDFEHFVHEWLNRKNVYAQRHFIPQFEFVCAGTLVPEVDFIGYFEHFERDFNQVQQRLGIPASLAHHNSSKRANYRKYYSDETRRIVGDVYREDVEIFGYTF